jgi:hypothetical protein
MTLCRLSFGTDRIIHPRTLTLKPVGCCLSKKLLPIYYGHAMSRNGVYAGGRKNQLRACAALLLTTSCLADIIRLISLSCSEGKWTDIFFPHTSQPTALRIQLRRLLVACSQYKSASSSRQYKGGKKTLERHNFKQWYQLNRLILSGNYEDGSKSFRLDKFSRWQK